nr:sugar phosphate isomerase/epimerase [Lachnospiraceae bacterium]
MNRLGLCDWYMLTPGTAAIHHAAKLGCGAVQISDLGGMTRNYPLRDPRIREEYLEAAAQENIALSALHASGLYSVPGMQCAQGSALRDAAAEEFKLGLDVCRAMDIPVITLVSVRESRCTNDEEFRNTAKFLKDMTALAKDAGVEIAYEHFCSTDQLVWLFDYVGEGMRLGFDSQNCVRDGFGDPIEVIRRLGAEQFSFVHLKDTPADRKGCAPLGKGICQVEEQLRLILEAGYDGDFVEENNVFLPPLCYGGMGLDLAAEDLDFVRRAIEKYAK